MGACCSPETYSSRTADTTTPENRERRASSGDKFRPANEQWHGYLGLDILPAAKTFLKDTLMHNFLIKMYDLELSSMLDPKNGGKIMAWSAVAYAPPQDPEYTHLLVRSTATMNVAMPDWAAEYWNTYIPADAAPVFEVDFPDWALYSALTLYDTHGMPVASVNSTQVERYLSGGPGADSVRISRSSGATGRTVFVNVLAQQTAAGDGSSKKLGAVSGPLCALFRVYRPRHITITPHESKPNVYLIPRSRVDDFRADKPATYKDGLLDISPLESAFSNGERIAETFTQLINKYMKPLKLHQQGTQFFHPLSVAGLFVNANATYVIAFVPPDKSGMVIEGSVPEYASFRPYYGIMAIDYHTTNTVSSMTFEHLGGWGAAYKVFAFRTLLEAQRSGYDDKDKTHKFFEWGTVIKGPLSIVLRYLHYFEANGKGGEEDAKLAADERRRLCERNGDDVFKFEVVPGCHHIEYV